MDAAIVQTAFDARYVKRSALRYVVAHSDEPEDVVPLYQQLYDDFPLDGESTASSTLIRKAASPTILVQLGYAVRMRIVLSILDQFLLYHADSPALQFVNLGSGLDVLGLYALQKAAAATTNRKKLMVLEVDGPAICTVKHEQLFSKVPWLKKEGGERYAHRYCPKFQLELIEADLNGPPETILKHIDATIPTLVLSELVLAYLDDATVLLKALVEHLDCRSCIALYEPLGPQSCCGSGSIHNLYKAHYTAQFHNKLQRGTIRKPKQNHNNQNDCCGPAFHSFAPSPATSMQSLTTAGVAKAYATCAGRVDSALRLKDTDLFDEHAALTLHLSSYVVCCGFLECTPNNWLLRHSLCNWSFPISPRSFIGQNTTYWISIIEATDERSVRDLFSKTYQPWLEQFPAIRKMVKTTLRKDLGVVQSTETHSAIGEYYRTAGGAFLVITDTSRSLVMGGVGIRKCNAKEKQSRNLSGSVYEIHRLFVSADVRGRGIGSQLLASAMELVRRARPPVQMIATTPTILQGANQFYCAMGFQTLDETDVGELTMRTYCYTTWHSSTPEVCR